mgnify:CR=1 FL=1
MKEKTLHNYVEKEFSNFKFAHEVKFFRKSIDFIYIDNDNNINAVELKIKDWRRSLNQMETNQLCANFCYLGIWHENRKSVSKKILKRNGFGLISISKNKCKLILSPKESSILKGEYKNLIKNQIEGE